MRLPAALSIGRAEVAEIDTVNIYHAGLLAMRRAVDALPVRPQHVLVDARTIPGVDVPQNCFNKGDGLDFSIAAASIVAKVHRDRLMDELARQHPEYGFERHKGYCTPEHQDAIRRLGPCAIHRQSFTFIRELRGEYSALFYDLKQRLDFGRGGGRARSHRSGARRQPRRARRQRATQAPAGIVPALAVPLARVFRS